MPVTLTVHGARWRAALDGVLATYGSPGQDLVPVIKGNGYGFERTTLYAECERRQVPMIAVGTYAEAREALAATTGDVFVLEPFRPAMAATSDPDELAMLSDPRLVHTCVSKDGSHALEQLGARYAAEGLTSMNRFGAPMADLAALVADGGCIGATLHLPLGRGHTDEIRRFVDALPQVRVWFLSHVSAAELASLRTAYPEQIFRPRIGTALWLADPESFEVTATVLEVRSVSSGAVAGYRGRKLGAGHLVILSGGTSHGLALEAPAPAPTIKAKAIVVAKGALQAAHRVRSPFVINGSQPRFVEPPHMQVSLVWLPADEPAPGIGDVVPVRARLTTTID